MLTIRRFCYRHRPEVLDKRVVMNPWRHDPGHPVGHAVMGQNPCLQILQLFQSTVTDKQVIPADRPGPFVEGNSRQIIVIEFIVG